MDASQGRPRRIPRRRGLCLHRGRRQNPQLSQVSLQSVFGEEERSPVLLVLPDIITGWSNWILHLNSECCSRDAEVRKRSLENST